MVAVVVNSDGDGGGDDRNDGNSEGSSRNGANWEVEQIKGTDGEGTMLVMVELRTEVTAEDI
jgi:hypothetical protein